MCDKLPVISNSLGLSCHHFSCDRLGSHSHSLKSLLESVLGTPLCTVHQPCKHSLDSVVHVSWGIWPVHGVQGHRAHPEFLLRLICQCHVCPSLYLLLVKISACDSVAIVREQRVHQEHAMSRSNSCKCCLYTRDTKSGLCSAFCLSCRFSEISLILGLQVYVRNRSGLPNLATMDIASW